MVDLLINGLEKLHPIDDALKAKVASVAKISEHKSEDYILKGGQTCDCARFIAKGLIRSYYIKGDRQVTSRFMGEGYIATSWISFYTQKPGNEYMQAVEETVIVSISYSDIQKLYREFPEFNTVVRKHLEYIFFLAEQRTQMLRKQTAEEKYRFLITNHPTLIQRVPLRHIASYLGMNEETLSRVRSKLKKIK